MHILKWASAKCLHEHYHYGFHLKRFSSRKDHYIIHLTTSIMQGVELCWTIAVLCPQGLAKPKQREEEKKKRNFCLSENRKRNRKNLEGKVSDELPKVRHHPSAQSLRDSKRPAEQRGKFCSVAIDDIAQGLPLPTSDLLLWSQSPSQEPANRSSKSHSFLKSAGSYVQGEGNPLRFSFPTFV